jgi:hypothetical protein
LNLGAKPSWINLMIPESCLLIETCKFPILPGEDQEIVNEGMYGKAFCQYLESALPLAGVRVVCFCAEDWGWWLDVECSGFRMGLCLYADPAARQAPERYALLPSVQQGRTWSWLRLAMVDHTASVLKLMGVVARTLEEDSDISSVTWHDDYPF